MPALNHPRFAPTGHPQGDAPTDFDPVFFKSDRGNLLVGEGRFGRLLLVRITKTLA
jgi:hypothetical protein